MDFLKHSQYQSPVGILHLLADEAGITNIVFDDKFLEFANTHNINDASDLFISDAIKFLDIYFSKKCPSFIPKLHLKGTSFQLEIWNFLLSIPYSKSCSYSDIAEYIAVKRGLLKMSSQAVGQAVSKNPIPVIIPCHRVIGKNGKLTGYSGGIDKKVILLEHEKKINFLI